MFRQGLRQLQNFGSLFETAMQHACKYLSLFLHPLKEGWTLRPLFGCPAVCSVVSQGDQTAGSVHAALEGEGRRGEGDKIKHLQTAVAKDPRVVLSYLQHMTVSAVLLVRGITSCEAFEAVAFSLFQEAYS